MTQTERTAQMKSALTTALRERGFEAEEITAALSEIHDASMSSFAIADVLVNHGILTKAADAVEFVANLRGHLNRWGFEGISATAETDESFPNFALMLAVLRVANPATREQAVDIIAEFGYATHVGGHHVAIMRPECAPRGDARIAIITSTAEDWN